MKSVIFGAGLQGELKLQRAPVARAEADHVVITLAVFVADAPAQTAYLDLVLDSEYAEHLSAHLTHAIGRLA